MDNLIIVGIGQFISFILLFGYYHIQIRDNRKSLEKHMQRSYTKKEVNDLIEMKQQPLVVSLKHMQKDITEIKDMLNRVLASASK